ncbi:BNR-4 repeat-containing protein [Paenibacillus sp. IB182496]|uniref:BNR-4 repeat-containing protein n=1 Tax=Paenibacillus sabuli TaxID=2772509 RepID=A0A927GTF3_9BACL|nr:BNR-4 repeat-containing protein [Paenibacillus sabuli]MBD2847518.1 BNR-4 repeat-containing protein [Paenibacillus sabuli]
MKKLLFRFGWGVFSLAVLLVLPLMANQGNQASAATTPYFFDGFESGWNNWISSPGNGTPVTSTNQAHEGSRSYMVDEDKDAITYVSATNLNQVVSIWFYDNASQANMTVLAFVDPNQSMKDVGIGVNTSVSTTKYVTRIAGTTVATSVDRTTGWHELVFDYRSSAKADLYIDGTFVRTTDTVSFFKRIALGDYWMDGQVSGVYYDEVTILNTFPWVTVEDAMGFEVEGAWQSEAYLLEDNPTFSEEDLLATSTTTYAALASGLSISDERVQAGGASGRWADHPYYPTISTRVLNEDWSDGNTVTFWVYSEEPTKEEVTLILYSDNATTEWKEFYYRGFEIDWTGWKQLRIPFQAFQTYGTPGGWDQMEEIKFSSKSFHHQPSPYTVLHLDDFRVTEESPADIANLLDEWTDPEVDQTFITKYPAAFEDVSLMDVVLFVNHLTEYETASPSRQAVLASQNAAILARNGLTGQSFTRDQFVDAAAAPLTGVHHDIVEMDPDVLNHSYPELRDTPTGAIQYEAYWKSERAVYGYNPAFYPGPVSLSPDGQPYIKYGNSIIQVYHTEEEQWLIHDIEPVYHSYITGTLGWDEYIHRDDQFYQDVKIRFDNDGDAYILATVQKLNPDGSKAPAIAGLLLHSTDGLKSWEIYELPKAFGKFENRETYNVDAMNAPPVITLSDQWANGAVDKGGYLLLPEKQPNGTLVLPSAIQFCDGCISVAPYHSGDANIAITSGSKVYLVFGMTDVTQSPSIPSNHPANSLSWVKNGVTYWSHDGVPTYIVSYDKTTQTVSDPVFVGYGGRSIDAHNWPALSIDSTARLHLAISGHHDPLYYVRAVNPNDNTAWGTPELVGSAITYPAMVMDADDTLYIIPRDSQRGYRFDLTLYRKEIGASWAGPVQLVNRFKPYYEVWNQKLTIDPATGTLYLSYYSAARQVQFFKDEYDAMMYIWPDRERLVNPDGLKTPVGTYQTPGRMYVEAGGMVPSEMTTLISTDGGDSWHLAETSDYAYTP